MPQLPSYAPPVPQGFAYAGHGFVPHNAVFLSHVEKKWIPAVNPDGVDVCVERHFALPVAPDDQAPVIAAEQPTTNQEA